ncbi:type I-D CRISPR-associated protein Cas10d/Csc3 [Halocatena pleomorpha]|uniref:Type I-D CRISPR-associated protein Cas10d/Csc3 n=1 Tax=Halocatena pleomorpha TaxID=1785090 RepID=A0A3P3R7F4_9EURY|nr:type I-D CRISPR-associated protein Cas10d/Csc3 [Halocatena pleomorpha]RRJ28493.1 type I-D CRISPR-associated protein Cas10d/Csc3 [Halocatena pleomorpha]
MNPAEFIEDVLKADDGDEGLSPSDNVYLRFRQTVDPGMFDAEFDVIPAKSRAVRSRWTGKPYTDQTLRSHVLNGAAFGARLNHALSRLDSSAALPETELLKVLALYACHDLHKTREAQQRRAGATDRKNADKDITKSETKAYVDRLRLSQLDTNLDPDDYRASALAAEENSGRHAESPSRVFTRYREWIRVMDAAAGLDVPVVDDHLEERVQAIDSDVCLASHSFDDTKGLSTNILHTTITDEICASTPAALVVYFVDGALYLVPDGTDIVDPFKSENTSAKEITDSFIETLREARTEFADPERMTTGINPDFQKGKLDISASMYLLSGVETSLRSARHLLRDRSENSDWGEYNTYEYAVQVGIAGDLLSEPLPSTEKAIPLGLQLSTYYGELYYPLSGEERRDAIRHLCKALNIPDVGEWISAETENWYLEYVTDTPSRRTLSTLAERFNADQSDVAEDLTSGVKLTSGGTRSFPILIAAAFLQSDNEAGVRWDERPLETILEAAEEHLLSYYRSWPTDWDHSAPISVTDSDTSASKREQFERVKEGLIWKSHPEYVRQNLQVNQRPIFDTDASKTKLGQYGRSSQPHVCLLCDDVLIGSRSLDDFKTTGSGDITFGFSHYKPITTEKGEPKSAICPQCELELTLRDAVHDTSSDGESHYLFLAPDYFYAPGDVLIEQRIREAVYFASGLTLLQLARSIVVGDKTTRASIVEEIFSEFDSAREGANDASFRNMVRNYDAMYKQDGALGLFRIDPPRRGTQSRKPITRIPSGLVSSMVATGMAWLTSSRVLLTKTQIPVTQFDEFNEQVHLNNLPGVVKRFTGNEVSISYRRDLGISPESFNIDSRLTQSISSSMLLDDADPVDESAEVAENGADSAHDSECGKTTSLDSTDRVSRHVNIELETDLETTLYKLASLFTVAFRAHGTEIQRVKTVLNRAKEPFPGAETMLRGKEQSTDPRALHSALVLDTLLYPTMSNRIDALADAGFNTLQPDAQSTSNYEYERLFRVARESISDGLAQNASQDELIDIVTGDVMKAAARAETPGYDDVSRKREPAEEFSTIFVDDIFYGLCDGDFYELRRHENHLASGYNAAIRRRLQEFFDEHRE